MCSANSGHRGAQTKNHKFAAFSNRANCVGARAHVEVPQPQHAERSTRVCVEAIQRWGTHGCGITRALGAFSCKGCNVTKGDVKEHNKHYEMPRAQQGFRRVMMPVQSCDPVGKQCDKTTGGQMKAGPLLMGHTQQGASLLRAHVHRSKPKIMGAPNAKRRFVNWA
jgi:hypothetical protein